MSPKSKISRSVLISIQPKWCRLIANGRKTIEIRKSRPKLKTPFKVYIYCTKGKQRLLEIMHDGDDCYGETYHGKPVFIKSAEDMFLCKSDYVNQKIMGEFVCDKIYTYTTCLAFQSYNDISTEDIVNGSLLSETELFKYEYSLPSKENSTINVYGNVGLFGWHISDLIIYDEPKELSEIGKSRPPQSWCYIENDGME